MERSIAAALAGNPYPGRGLLCGRSADGTRALAAYFITGRSAASRGRILARTEDGVATRAPGGPAGGDPALLLYAAARRIPGALIAGNGSHTDLIAARLAAGGTLEEALSACTFEPDAPHYTPRIALVLRAAGPSCALAIVRRGAAGACERAVFPVPRLGPGEGYLLHTYAAGGDPLPPFAGAPRALRLPDGGAAELLFALWAALPAERRVAAYACALRVPDGAPLEERIVNAMEERTVSASGERSAGAGKGGAPL